MSFPEIPGKTSTLESTEPSTSPTTSPPSLLSDLKYQERPLNQTENNFLSKPKWCYIIYNLNFLHFPHKGTLCQSLFVLLEQSWLLSFLVEGPTGTTSPAARCYRPEEFYHQVQDTTIKSRHENSNNAELIATK